MPAQTVFVDLDKSSVMVSSTPGAVSQGMDFPGPTVGYKHCTSFLSASLSFKASFCAYLLAQNLRNKLCKHIKAHYRTGKPVSEVFALLKTRYATHQWPSLDICQCFKDIREAFFAFFVVLFSRCNWTELESEGTHSPPFQ